ncbi:hypothetical protein EDD21DRAFT_412921 [Dissophora ornata]|nr:hypothetical protein EDD21DRAFT_412921 [Dissophora ornata]
MSFNDRVFKTYEVPSMDVFGPSSLKYISLSVLDQGKSLDNISVRGIVSQITTAPYRVPQEEEVYLASYDIYNKSGAEKRVFLMAPRIELLPKWHLGYGVAITNATITTLSSLQFTPLSSLPAGNSIRNINVRGVISEQVSALSRVLHLEASNALNTPFPGDTKSRSVYKLLDLNLSASNTQRPKASSMPSSNISISKVPDAPLDHAKNNLTSRASNARSGPVEIQFTPLLNFRVGQSVKNVNVCGTVSEVVSYPVLSSPVQNVFMACYYLEDVYGDEKVVSLFASKHRSLPNWGEGDQVTITNATYKGGSDEICASEDRGSSWKLLS